MVEGVAALDSRGSAVGPLDLGRGAAALAVRADCSGTGSTGREEAGGRERAVVVAAGAAGGSAGQAAGTGRGVRVEGGSGVWGAGSLCDETWGRDRQQRVGTRGFCSVGSIPNRPREKEMASFTTQSVHDHF